MYSSICNKNTGSSIEENYTKEQLLDKLVIYDSKLHKYSVYDSIDDFVKRNKSVYCNEVSFGWMPQKFKVDIDGIDPYIVDKYLVDSVEYEVSKNKIINMYISFIINIIKDIFFSEFVISLTDSEIVICGSQPITAATSPKWSFHVIVDGYCFKGNLECKAIAGKIRTLLIDQLQRFVDFGVYGKTQNLRVAGNIKPDDDRRKIIMSDHSLQSTLITQCQNCKLIDFTMTQEDYSFTCDEYVEQAIHILAPHSAQHKCKFLTTKGNILVYKRTEPAHCEFCDRTHTTDNTFIGFITIGDKIIVGYNCRRAIEAKVANRIAGSFSDEKRLWELIKETGAIYNYDQFDLLPTKNIYSMETMSPYEITDTLCVRAGMGLGKTKQLVNYINEAFPKSKLTSAKIIILSFRQTFSVAMKTSFPDFVLYSDVSGRIKADRVIVQLESLHRLQDMIYDVDLLVADECESIFDQFNSGLFKKLNVCFGIFRNLLRNVKHAIFMDANLSNRTYNIISHFRRGEVYFHHNKYVRTHRNYILTSNEGQWMMSLINDVVNGKNVVVAVNSINTSKAIKEIIEIEVTGVNVAIYNSETDIDIKKLHFSDVAKYWKVDVLIYTPTVSAGVSFEEEHFDVLYAYMINSCNVETALQMLGRVRNIAENNYIVYLTGETNTLPTSTAAIERSINHNRDMIFEDSTNMLDFEFASDGGIMVNKNQYYYLWVENTKVNNASKNNYAKRFISYLKAGHNITYYNKKIMLELFGEYDTEQIELYRKMLIDTRGVLRYLAAEQIATSKEITYDEFCDITQRIQEDKSIDVTEMNSFELYKLRSYFKYEGEINGDFVLQYNNSECRKTFKLLSELYIGSTIEESFNLIKAAQKNKLEMYNDTTANYTYPNHKLMYKLMQILELDTFDLRIQSYNQERLDTLIKTNIEVINDLLSKLFERMEFKFKPCKMHDKIYITRRTVFGKINKVLTAMYDKAVVKSSGDSYSVTQGSKFGFKDEPDRPKIKNSLFTN